MAKPKSLSVKTFPWKVNGAVFIITVLSFAVSYHGLYSFAVAHEIGHWVLCLIWPVIIDGAVLTASGVALSEKLKGKSGTGYFVTSMIMTAVSTALNVVHMIEGEEVWPIVTYIAHAIAPLMVGASIEIALLQAAAAAKAEPRITVFKPETVCNGRSRTLTPEQAQLALAQHGSRRRASKALKCAFKTFTKALNSGEEKQA